MLFGFLAIFIVLFFYFIFCNSFYNLKFQYYWAYKFLIKKWFFDIFFNKLVVFYSFIFGYKLTYQLIDKGVLELFGPNGLLFFCTQVSKSIQKSFFSITLSLNFFNICLFFIGVFYSIVLY
jgi:hypothetical protein